MPILLYVNAWSYEQFDFYIPDTATIDDIKEQISLRLDVSASKLSLTENGRPFTAIRSSPIKLTCMIDADPGLVNLTISHLSISTKHYITVPRTHTIGQIKEQLSISQDDTSAYRNYKKLNNDTTVTELPNGSAIHIGPSNYQIGTPNQQIFVRTPDRATLVFNVDSDQPVSELKQMIEARYGIPADEILFESGGFLSDNNTFREERIYRDDTINVLFRSRGGAGVIPIGSTRPGDPPVKAKKKSVV
jgi:hypothetical protein